MSLKSRADWVWRKTGTNCGPDAHISHSSIFVHLAILWPIAQITYCLLVWLSS